MRQEYEPLKRKDGSNYRRAKGVNKGYIPPQGFGGQFVRKQIALRVTGPVYTYKQVTALIEELTVRGRTIPNFHCIETGENQGKYREVIGTKIISHYSQR